MMPATTSFATAPLLVSQSLLQLWLMPLRLMQVMFSAGAGAIGTAGTQTIAATDAIENRTTEVIEAAEEQIAETVQAANEAMDKPVPALTH